MFDLLQKMYDIFCKQDNEKDYFDVTFDVQGKNLYAHRGALAAASSVFKSQFMRPNPAESINQPIQITDYTYDEFYEFLRLIYAPNVSPDEDDAFAFQPKDDQLFSSILLCHEYVILQLKEKCEKYLVLECMKIENIKDVFKTIGFTHENSLKDCYANLREFVDENFSALIGYSDFVNLDKYAVKGLVEYAADVDGQEELCEAVYKWGVHQAKITVEMKDEEKKKLILQQIKDIFPCFNPGCLIEFFGKKKGLISINEANQHKTIEVTVLGSNFSKLTGTFVDEYGIYEVIHAHEDYELTDHGNKRRGFWWTTFSIPKTPSTVQKMKGCEWYLLLEENESLKLKHRSLVQRSDYLLAEMKVSNENQFGDVNDKEFEMDEFDIVYATVARKK